MAEFKGVIIAAHGRHYMADANGQRLQCVTRGKKSDVAVGDIVRLKTTSSDQAVIEGIEERKTLLYRSDQYKSKLLAANVTRLFIVVATEPSFADDLVSRSLVAAESAGVEAHILLNKIDMTDALPRARERLALYAGLGYPVHEMSARTRPEEAVALLTPLMQGQSSILIGQSGMGKSSLIQLLVPDADIAVREISVALDTGKHTTTFTRMYRIDESTSVIDSPGFQEFGLHHLTEGMLERAFPEFKPFLGGCRFYNCHHVAEPGCAVLDAVKEEKIAAMRHALYLQLRHEAMQKIGY
ncbi:ribosome small subunit-dependent GTPase A [Noviherbaspirillum pedocola]|uniref:Small ribosomal subunit biogenesis GTPase RsgA n=1 Tax=Noviherbaspirillum pedocola TaxID=2801341 RepID=A0A934SQK1_9BURK|nr:ribosome small subunit-dependent GTPase A [Noviherbaspirillum pedocola]MBK4733296.1 ribosome small subunit-dependent GTPase A [Noviherbaspirillum pedocola]